MTDLTQLGRFGVIYADLPWSYHDLGHSRRIGRQYPIMSVRDLATLPVQPLALPNAVLFLWRRQGKGNSRQKETKCREFP
jgi:hypothetical protein